MPKYLMGAAVVAWFTWQAVQPMVLALAAR